MDNKQLFELVKSSLDGLKTRITDLETELGAAKGVSEKSKTDLAEQIANLTKVEGRLDEMIKKGGRTSLGPVAGKAFSLSNRFRESPEWEEMKKSGGVTSRPMVIKGGFMPHIRSMMMRKDLTAAGSPIVQEDRIPGIVDVRFRPLTIRDLFPSFTTTSDSIEYVEETRFSQVAATSTSVITATVSTTVDVDNINGFKPGATVTIDPDGTAEDAVIAVGGVTAATADDPSGTITFTGAITAGFAVGALIVSDEFNMTPEATLKPKADIKLEVKNSPVKTLAHWLAASRQILNDADQMRAHVDFRLLQGLGLEEERQILYGNNTSTELDGIISNANTPTYAQAAGPATDEKQDAIRRAMTLVQNAHYAPDGIIMHPTDWEGIELSKDLNDRYLVTTQVSMGAEPRLWRLPIVVTTAINAGTALVGSFALGAQLYDREQSSIRMSEHHENFFARNMVAILAEERLTLTLTRPESFVVVTFT